MKFIENMMAATNGGPGFSLLDTGRGERLEQWEDIRLIRPDPQAIWDRHLSDGEWDRADARFIAQAERGMWQHRTDVPASWPVRCGEIKLWTRLSPFKHTGIFPEQSLQWSWMASRLKRGERSDILNLFGYTGGATISLTQAGCFVTHVDASKPSLGWAKDNQSLNRLPEDSVRWILEDAAKFVSRELKRGRKYDGILMDPPAFGHGPTGKTWKFNKDLPPLLTNCISLLSDRPKFLLINGYATNSSAVALRNLLEDTFMDRKGSIESGELCLRQTDNRIISTGIFARWTP